MKLLIIASLLVLLSCGESQAQKDCENAGGIYESHWTGIIPVWTGKTMVVINQYEYECVK